MKKVLFAVIFALLMPLFAHAADNCIYMVDPVNGKRVLKLNPAKKSFKVIYSKCKPARCPNADAEVPGYPEGVFYDGDNIFVSFYNFSTSSLIISPANDPDKVAQKIDIDLKNAESRYRCRVSKVDLLYKIDDSRILAVFDARYGEEYFRSKLFFVINLKDGSMSDSYYRGDLRMLPIFDNAGKAYFKATDNTAVVIVDLLTAENIIKDSGIRNYNLQLSCDGKKWWMYDEVSRRIICYDPVDEKWNDYRLSLPVPSRQKEYGYYMWSREPFIFTNSGVAFQATYYYLIGEEFGRDRVDEVRKFFVYGFNTQKAKRVGPLKMIGCYKGCQKTKDGSLIFTMDYSHMTAHAYKFDSKYKLIYDRKFKVPGGKETGGDIKVSNSCYMFEPEGKVSVYSEKRGKFVLMINRT